MGFGLVWGAWVSVSAAMFLELAGGHVYLFSKYSDDLKTTLFANESSAQAKIQSMALAANLGNYLPFAGPFYDSRVGGPTRTMLVGMVLTFTGYFTLYLAAEGTNVPYGLLLVACALWGHGSSYYNASAIATCLKNFPHHRGIIVGLLSSFFGLSASVMVQFYYAWFQPDDDTEGSSAFLLFLATGTSVIALASTVFLSRSPPVPDKCPIARRRFRAAQVVVTILASLVLGVALANALMDKKPKKGDVLVDVVVWVMVALVLLITLLPIGSASSHASYEDIPSPEPKPTNPRQSLLSAPGRAGPELTPLQAARTAEFWLLFATLVPICGGGLTVINNLGQMAKARGSENLTDVLIQMISVFNCFSRMATGAVSDAMAHRISRPTIHCIVLLLMIAGHSFLALPFDQALFPGACVTGFAYGSVWAVFPPMLSEFFGLPSFASLYTFFVLSASIGSLVFSTVVATAVYNHHQDSSGDCYGAVCYQVTHITLVAASTFGLILGLWLRARTRDLYVTYIDECAKEDELTVRDHNER